QDRADLDAAVRETVRPTVTTLRAFAIVAALVTLTVIGLMVARQSRRGLEVRRSLRALGATRPQVAWWSAVPVLAAVACGVLGAVAVGYLVSPVGPMGTVRRLAPDAGLSLPAAIVLPLAAGLLLAIAVVVAGVSARSAWRAASGQ